MYLSFQYQMSKKEREIHKYKIEFINLFVCPLSNDSITSA